MFNTRTTTTRDPATGEWSTTRLGYIPSNATQPPRKRSGAGKRFLLISASLVGGLMIIGAFNTPAPTPSAQTETAPVALATTTPAAPTAPVKAVEPDLMPPAEKAFIRAIEDAKHEYEAGANDMAKGASRPHRKAALCSVLRDGARGWTGTIARLSSNGDGKGVLSIQLTPDVTVKTWNNSLSDISDQTLIEPDSVMYRQLVAMKNGDKVTFTGNFFPSDSDCVKEASITQRGSMSDPEFIVRFTDVRPL
jgi:hypothetical protein